MSKALTHSDKQTSSTSAAVLAQELEKPFSNAFVKCRYIHRTFILSGQRARQSAVRRKLSPIASEFKGKVVCIVDDSLVRGTTSREIVRVFVPTKNARQDGGRYNLGPLDLTWEEPD